MTTELDLNLDHVADLPSAGHHYDSECAWCETICLHRVVWVWDWEYDPDDTFESRPVLREGTRFVLATCTRCEAPLLLAMQAYVDELWQMDSESVHWQQLWPTTKRQLSAPVGCPEASTDLLNQAQACHVHSPTAAVLLTRKAVEVITASLGFHGNLGANLRRMRDQGVIDHRLWTWSDLLRQVGNQGAHDLEGSMSADDASDAIWFATELIHQVFVVQPRFDAFAERHPHRALPTSLRLVVERPNAASQPD